MDAMTLKCPMCGASAATDASKCEHCGARLATIACPVCFGMMFRGAKFCSHCGAAASREERDVSDCKCPRCGTQLNETRVGEVELLECPACEGLWADTVAFARIQNDRERYAAVLGAAENPAGSIGITELQVRYVRCPVCSELMHRLNFAGCSNVIVDVCKPHGTWFDRDELRRIVEFISGGGLERSRQRQIAELERQRRRLAAEKAEAARDAARYGDTSDIRAGALSFAFEHLADFLR